MSDPKLAHYVNPEPWNPLEQETLTAEQEKYYQASQWRLMWFKFRRHRIAVWSAVILAIMYLTVPFAEVIAPYTPSSRDNLALYSPPQAIHLFDQGSFVGPFVYAQEPVMNLEDFKWDYRVNRDKVERLRFFCSGEPYSFWGLFEADFHLVCPAVGGQFHLLGTDRIGRDLFSGIVYGARLSLTVGLIGVAISFMLGITLGGIAGYYGGFADNIIQRLIEILNSLPRLPMWMGLSAALPVTWPPVLIFLGITVLLGILDWPGLARAVRSKLLALREEDYAIAAELMGAKPSRIIGRHLLPGFMSHLIASATLSIPTMILGETALSFLGLGLKRPVVSWGVLLNEAQNITIVTVYPWLMIPVIPVILVILAFNFMGDGLRDAADPYK